MATKTLKIRTRSVENGIFYSSKVFKENAYIRAHFRDFYWTEREKILLDPRMQIHAEHVG